MAALVSTASALHFMVRFTLAFFTFWRVWLKKKLCFYWHKWHEWKLLVLNFIFSFCRWNQLTRSSLRKAELESSGWYSSVRSIHVLLRCHSMACWSFNLLNKSSIFGVKILLERWHKAYMPRKDNSFLEMEFSWYDLIYLMLIFTFLIWYCSLVNWWYRA